MAVLGIDVGTSSVKALAVGESGRVLAQSQESHFTQRPKPGWAEQDPDDWWQAVVRVLRNIAQNSEDFEIEAIGLTGQMHGPVLLDRHGKPLCPCLLWMDNRATEQASELIASLGERHLLEVTGNRAVAAFPAAKLLWWREHHPETFRAARMVLMPKDYIGFRLTGRTATDPSDASGTLLFDLQKRAWCEELAQAIALPIEALPEIIPSTSQLGAVQQSAARETGLKEGVSVFMGAGDLATAALGNGLAQPNQMAITLGTAGQLLFHLRGWPQPLLGKFYLFASAVPELHLGLGTIPTGGAALRWLSGVLAADGEPSDRLIQKMIQQAQRVPSGARGLIFLPYLAGTGTPQMDYLAKGIFFGLSETHGRGELTRAVMEGVAFALRESLEQLRQAGLELREVRIAGGGVKIPLWRQIQADVYNATLYPIRVLDASPIGACLLAAVACGHFDDLEKACRITVQTEAPVMPSKETVSRYDEGYEIFRQLYRQLRISFTALHEWSSPAAEVGE